MKKVCPAPPFEKILNIFLSNEPFPKVEDLRKIKVRIVFTYSDNKTTLHNLVENKEINIL